MHILISLKTHMKVYKDQNKTNLGEDLPGL